MKITSAVIISLLGIGLIFGCSGQKRHHDTDLGDPSTYQAHFPDMDTSGDDLVDWKEFKAYFPQADTDTFKALDLNNDGYVNHEEWHEFKEAHGLKDH